MASTTALARVVIFSRITALSPKHLPLSSLPRFLPNFPNRRFPAIIVSCLNSGNINDDYSVSTQKLNLDRGLLVIANMLNNIEPLDNSVISNGVSYLAKKSMNITISTMLGILPSDQFSVSISVSKPPFRTLLFSSIVTGYTLWNVEYRVSLMRNLERAEETEEAVRPQRRVQMIGDLSPEALKYIEKLQAELSDAEEELNVQKKENLQMKCERENRNDLLEYLRSLDADMVTELSRPSSVQVEEIIYQLVQNIVQRLFKNELTRNSGIENNGNHQDTAEESSGTVRTSRDYLAKLLFWCMLLGHHLRGLENRLHLSCVVGLL